MVEGLQLLIPTLGGDYADAVLALSPLAYWQSAEGSGTDIIDSSGNGYDGTYTGITWDGTTAPQGTPAPYYDRANDYGNVYSAGLAGAVDLDELTVSIWVKTDPTTWTTNNLFIWKLVRDANNLIQVFHDTASNQLRLSRIGDSTVKTGTYLTSGPTDWFNLITSCSVSGGGNLAAGEAKMYYNGAAVTTLTGNVASTGSGLSSTETVIGALNTTPTNVWGGYIAHMAVWNRPVDDDILALATVS